MGDISAPPLAEAASNNELAPKISTRSSASHACSDKTVTPPLPNDVVVPQPQLGRGSAMFSTGLGTRAPRKLQGPPYPPVLTRTDRNRGVVMAAAIWREKYPYQYLCIFPQSGWQIGDLWDEQDIHLDTESFCKKLLRFIERDVCVCAQNFAQHWSRIHPERLRIVGGDMTDLYDKNDHLSIVNKIFVNGEQQEYPPIFLWHVAHIMRTAMLEVKGVKLPAKDIDSATEPLETGHDGLALHGTLRISAATVGAATNSSTYVVNPPHPMPVSQSMPAHHDARPLPRPSNGMQHHGGRYAEPVGHMMIGVPGTQTGGPNLLQSNVHVTKNRPGRPASGLFNQGMSSGPYGENMPRGSSGSHPRQHTGPMPMPQSPRLHQAPMTINNPMVNAPHVMAPFVYEQNAMTPGMIAGPPLHPGVMHPSMMPLHSMQSTSMMQSHPRQSSGSQGPPYAAPMGDMTNMHYPPDVSPHHIDHRRPGERRYSQQHGNGSALYDPYEGNNPAFRASKKQNQSSFQNSNNRQRKASIPGRSYHNQYTNDRPSHVQPSGRPLGPKGYSEDDLAITQDREYGCHTHWIGPQNTTVTEIFIGDLPEDIQDAELAALFQDRIGVRPKSIIVRHAFQPHENYLGRKHAFVAFSSATDSRQAISIRDPTIRGLSVSITVPKRFFQTMMEVSKRDTIEPGPPSNSRFISYANNRETRNRVPATKEGSDVTASTIATKDEMSYSPQDARSDLHKKKKGKQAQQTQQGSTAVGSPETRKSKPKKRQESLKKEELVEPTPAVRDDTLNEDIKVEDDVPTSGTAEATLPDVGASTEQPSTNNDTTSKLKEEISPTVAEGVEATVLHKAETASISSTSQRSHATPQQVEPRPQEVIQRADSQIRDATQSPAKEPTNIGGATKESSPTELLKSGDVAADDKLKNDATFRSAPESQSGLDLVVEPSAIANIANQGSTHPLPKDTEPSTTEISPSAPDTAPANDIASTAADSKSVALSAGDNPSATVPMAPNLSPTDAKLVMVTADKQQEITSFSASPVAPEPVKKSGAQHTESLHPFSKVSKAQARKEKEQKRKALKKEKEQAEKGRAVRTTAAKPAARSEPTEKDAFRKDEDTAEKNGVTDEAVVAAESDSTEKNTMLSGNKGPSTSSQGVLETDSSAKKPASTAKTTKGAADGRDKPGKRKGKKPEAAVAASAVIVESKDDDHGKQTGGTISIPNESGSVTKKEVKSDMPEDAPDLDAQFSKREVSKEDTPTDAQDPDPTAVTGSGSTKSSKKKKPKKKLRRVWPSLEFRPRSPNPSWMGPIDMESDVQNYDQIINEALGGSDDSDYSWADLPKHGSSEDEKPSSVSDLGGDRDKDRNGNESGGEKPKRMASLQTQQAADDLVSLHSTATNLSQEKQKLGEALYPKIAVMQPEFVGKITSLLLELDISELTDLISNNSALRAKVEEAMGIRDDFIKSKKDDGEKEAAVTSKPLKFNLVSEDDKAAIKRVKAALNEQLDAKSQELDAVSKDSSQHMDSQTPSNTAMPDSQPAKKKPNKKKKKTQPQSDLAADLAEPVEAANIAEVTETEKPTLRKTVSDSVDPNDPFYDQLKGIEAIKRGDAVMADAQDAHLQRHAEIAKSLADPQFLRTMEGYFKETQGSSQSKGKGRKVSKEDLL